MGAGGKTGFSAGLDRRHHDHLVAGLGRLPGARRRPMYLMRLQAPRATDARRASVASLGAGHDRQRGPRAPVRRRHPARRPADAARGVALSARRAPTPDDRAHVSHMDGWAPTLGPVPCVSIHCQIHLSFQHSFPPLFMALTWWHCQFRHPPIGRPRLCRHAAAHRIPSCLRDLLPGRQPLPFQTTVRARSIPARHRVRSSSQASAAGSSIPIPLTQHAVKEARRVTAGGLHSDEVRLAMTMHAGPSGASGLRARAERRSSVHQP